MPNPDHGAEDPIPVNWTGLILEREQGPFFLSPTANFAGTERTNVPMYLFENSIEVDATVFQCVKAWQECAQGWMANENFLQLEALNTLLDRQHIQLSFKQRGLNWVFLPSSDTTRQVLRWHYYGSAIHTSGLLFFDFLNNNGSRKTKITFRLLFPNSFNGLDSLKLEMHTGLAIQNTLKQLKRIIASHMAQTRKAKPSPDHLQQNNSVPSYSRIQEDLIYATA